MENLIFKQYNYMSNIEPNEFYVPPFDFNYDLYGLYKKRTFNKGELNKIDYYGYVDSGRTFQDLILTEHREYFRKDSNVYKRKVLIDWYLEDGTVGANKTTYKYYSPEESLKLGERRRQNVISNLKVSTVGLIQIVSGVTLGEATEIGVAFLGKITNEITMYVGGLEEPLKTKIITCDDCDWLDNEIPNTGGILVRQYLYSAIDIDYSDKLE